MDFARDLAEAVGVMAGISMQTRARLGGVLTLATLVVGGCGAKTGLLLPDATPEADVEDADVDLCRPDPVPIDRRRAEVMLVIDRSSSMLWALSGGASIPGEPTRWEVLQEALAEVLPATEHLLEFGAKFFPLEVPFGTPIDPDTACTIDEGIDLRPAPENTEALLRFFRRTTPTGGTPTAPALDTVRMFVGDTQTAEVAQFVVLATDGGPNCNDRVNPAGCICTGPDSFCEEPSGGFFNCLDSERTLDVIEGIFDGLGVPVYVIGIDDPTRPDLADFLDEMAVTGGRPRTEPEGRRFYSIRREGDLFDALGTITGSIARCVFVVEPEVATDPRLEIVLDGEPLPFDPDRVDGWDWSELEAGELTIFGPACDRAALPGAEVTARLLCDEE